MPDAVTNTMCPRCGSDRIATIMYGEPVWSPDLERAEAAGEVIIEGWVVSDDDPDHGCRVCGRRF